ncbi:MAG TPA: hypothetical protein EYP56_09500 [Planctomycetaceae bacterium]|nr:hypothetical protein [Planctomycetaceae bacterium]
MYRITTTAAIAFLAVLAAPFALAVFGAAPPKTAVEALIRAGAEGTKAQATLIQAQASMVNALSQSRKMAADTRKTIEECRGLSLENDLKTAKTFYDKRAKRAEYRLAHARPRPTPEVIARLSSWGKPKRLNEVAYRPVSQRKGDNLPWPAPLLRPDFEDLRLQLDIAFGQRSASNCGVGSPVHCEVRRLASQLQQALKGKIREMSPTEYIVAKRFLQAVVYETRFAPGSGGDGNQVAAAKKQGPTVRLASLTH